MYVCFSEGHGVNTFFFSFTGPLVYFTIKILKKLLIIKK